MLWRGNVLFSVWTEFLNNSYLSFLALSVSLRASSSGVNWVMAVVFCHSGISEKSFHVPYSLPCFLPLLVIYCEFLWMERVVFPSASCSCILWYPRASLQNGKYDLEGDVILVFPRPKQLHCQRRRQTCSFTGWARWRNWVSEVTVVGCSRSVASSLIIYCCFVNFRGL